MASWDEILSLPVQNPPTLEFSAANLVWSKVEGWRDNIDRLALIPFARVDDFVRGESANKDCPSRFHVEARRRRAPKNTYKQKVDGILEYILYWCSFGPDDHRKGGVVRPSRNTYVPKKKNAGRPNTKRGCTCHFIVKRLIAEPSVALIIYNQDKHVDKKGLPCHGPQDKKAEGTRAMFAPYISEDLRLRVLSLLHVGVSVETIMQRHSESVEKQGGPSNRDDLLTHRFVRRQERSIRRSMYELDPDDAVSVSMWVENHQSNVFFYEDFSDSDPFTLGIQTEWQLQQMIRFGNRGLLASDSRLGTNKLKYPVHSLIVYNSEKKAIPVAWIITPRFACGEAHKWMRALYNRVCTKDPSWKLAGFIVDDPLSDILTVRDVFQCSVLLSFWRVRHSWHKNLVKRCSDKEVRAQIFRRLGQALDDVCRGHGNVEVFDALMEDFIDSSDFIDYFKAVWYPRLGSWTAALKALPLASHETAATMEFYHNQMKIRLLNEKNCDVYQRADWLMDKLGTKVHSYFWLDEYSEKDYFSRYWRDEWTSGITSWCKASNIPDSDVVIEGRCAKVTDMLDREKFHVVWNPGTEFAICSCGWAEMGNICEHVFKAIKLYRDKGYAKPSISLFQYGQALMEMLRLPTHDSLIRDYAVSLAVSVEKELKSLSDFNKNRCEINHVQEEANSLRQNVMSDQDGLAGENPSIDESASADDMDVDNDVTNGVNEVVIIDSGARPADVKWSENSSPVSPPGIHSVDEFESKDGPNGESTDSQCPNAGGILSSKRDPSEKQIGLGADKPMDVQTPFVDICMESIEEDTVSNQNIVLSKDQEMSFFSETTDDDAARGEKPNMNHARTEDVQTPFIDIPMESIEENTASNQNTVSSKDPEMSVFSEMVSFETFQTEKPNVNHAGTETNSSQQQIVISEQDRDVAVENPVMDDGTSAHDVTDAYEVKDGAQKNVVADPAKRLAENANSLEMKVGPSPISLSPARKSVDEVVSKGVENRDIVTHKQHIEVCGQKNVPNNDVQMSITSETFKAKHVQAEKSYQSQTLLN